MGAAGTELAKGSGQGHRPDETQAHAGVALAAGFGAGMVVAGLLNPVDRALYLSVAQRTPFLHRSNFRNPFQGLGQTIVGRAISTGMWFPLERISQRYLNSGRITGELSPWLSAALAGQAAGAANALLMHPVNFIKYNTWSRPESDRSFRKTAANIYRKTGTVRIFFRGLPATVLRDALWGGTFGWLRRDLRLRFERSPWGVVGGKGTPDIFFEARGFMADFVAAGLATCLSAPVNYARNMQFAARLTEKTPQMTRELRGLFAETLCLPNLSQRAWFLLERTNVGWGTLRVGFGMALTAHLFVFFSAVGDSVIA